MIMRRWLPRIGIGLLVLLAAIALQHIRLSPTDRVPDRIGADLRIATWNVHYILTNRREGRWGLSGWEVRREPMDETFSALDADLVAFQEMESFSGGNEDSDNLARSWLLENNPGYAAAAIGDWRDFPSTQPILYRTDRLGVLDQGWFFFSDTPEVIYSRSFDGRYPAFASWVRFDDRATGAQFRVLNLHFDAGSRENRRRSADLVAERIAPWIADGETVIVAGDVNALRGSRLHRAIAAAGITFPRVPGATFHLDRGVHLLPAIDHIGLSEISLLRGGPWVFRLPDAATEPSDHYPVLVDIALPD
ncbi:endonuclease [Rhodobacterales bacterium HKCCE4037]|nr:endonuclease [Rhodobacterales bacterium HKCCE4037]